MTLTPPEGPAPAPLVLTPPEPVAAVPRTAATELVPLPEETRAALARRAEEFTAGLAGLDARSPEFARRIAEIDELGGEEIRRAAGSSNRMLERAVRSLDGPASRPSAGGGPRGPVDSGSRVADALVELRRTITDLEPGEGAPRGALTRLLSRLPGGNRARDHLARYASSSATLDRIVTSLRGGQDELRRDNAVLAGERTALWETLGRLQECAALTEALDAAVAGHVADLERRAPEQAEALRADLLFPIRRKHQDLLTQLAVGAQGYLAMDVVRRGNDELIKGVDRAATTTVSALRIAVLLASALDRQRAVIAQVDALRGTTDELIRGNARMLDERSADVARIAADPAVGEAALREAFASIRTTLDTIDGFRARATENMAETVANLSEELRATSAHLERTRAADELGGGR
ncbi:toxic anion resistance protein [Streptomyces sp. BI20]|uniref:toxic anion resistance protein n=1 Tax=Streptomyces sp. BI20 TaxID=3403460 RepID=UPI003C731FC9